MKNAVKQISSFILPVIVLILVPLWIEKDISIKYQWALLIAVLLIYSGLYLMILTITTFIRIGKGTLAPWNPTKKFITDGIYGYVRNPMIIGVLIVLTGESVAVWSLNILIWAVIFFIINNIWFALYEEPDLKRKFGDEYLEYKKNVPRWIPRLKPYKSKPK